MNNHTPNIETLAGTVPGVIYRIDLRLGVPVFISDAILETSGYAADEILSGKVKWIDLVIEEDRALVSKNMETSSVTPLFSIEYRIRHKSGDLRWILNRGSSVWFEGEPRWRDGIILDVSAAKFAALELETKKNDFANLLNSLDDIVFEIDDKAKFKNYYAKEWHTFMLPPDSFINKTIGEAFCTMTDFASLFEKAYQKTLAEKRNQKIEYSYQKEGKVRWFRAKFINLQQPGTVSIMVRDITKRKNAELALKKREQELELAIQGGDLGTWNWYITTGEISFNEGCANMFGYLHDEVIPHISEFEKLIHPDDKAYVMGALQAHLNGQTEFYETDYRIRHKDRQNWVWVLHRGKVVEQDIAGRAIRMSGTFLDISARKEAEYANISLRFKLEEFKAAINEATIVSIADLKGTIKHANQKFREISQYSLDELVGQKHNVINSGYHPRSFWQSMWKTIRKGNVWRAEVKNKRKDGSYYWVDTFIIPLRNTEHQIFEYLSIRNDISEKKENEIRLQNALEKAEESDRLKSAFLANISHEIRTPMNAILGFSELLLKGRKNLSDGKRAKFAEHIHDRSQDLLGVVNNILDISKIEAGQMSAVLVTGNIAELLNRLAFTLRTETLHLRNKDIFITSVNRLTTEQNIVKADFLRLFQVLNNLVSNAAKFTSQGSIEIGCKLSGPDFLEFWVRDTGIGIAEDKLDIVFLPFRQADELIHQQYGGSGLGLAISKGLVELWGGRIWVESECRKGSAFHFTVPYIPADPAPKETSNRKWKDKTVVLFNKGASSQTHVEKLLAETGSAVIHLSQENLANEVGNKIIDVAILDLGVPDVRSLEMAKFIKGKGIPIIALTAFDQTETKRRDNQNFIDYYLVKPVNHKTLSAAFAYVLKEFIADGKGL